MSNIHDTIKSYGGGPAGYFYTWLNDLFNSGRSCGLDLIDRMCEANHPLRCDANATAATLLTEAKKAGWILFDGQSPQAFRVPRFDEHLNFGRWQADVYAWIHAFTPGECDDVRLFLAQGAKVRDAERIAALEASGITYEVITNGKAYGSPFVDLNEAIASARLASAAGREDIGVYGSDKRPEARTRFWKEGSIDQFGRWVTL